MNGRRVAVAAATLLVVLPLAFTLARAANFHATRLLAVRAVPPYPVYTDVRGYRALLADPQLRRETWFNARDAVGSYDDVVLVPGPEPHVLALTVAGDTPEHAKRFADALAIQLQGASQRALGLRAADEVRVLRGQTTTGLSRSQRRARARLLRRLESFGPYPPPPMLVGAPAARPPLDRWADRLVDALPGDFAGRPSPIGAAAAGAVVALVLLLAGRALRRRRRALS